MVITEQVNRMLTNYLIRLGFFYDNVEHELSDLTNLPHTEFKYKNKFREVALTYHYLDVNNNIQDFLSIAIIKQPYKEIDDFMGFELYLKKIIPDFDKREFQANSYEGSFEEKIEKVLNKLMYYFDNYGREILVGNEWEKGFYYPW